jgi:hypothetical protein
MPRLRRLMVVGRRSGLCLTGRGAKEIDTLWYWCVCSADGDGSGASFHELNGLGEMPTSSCICVSVSSGERSRYINVYCTPIVDYPSSYTRVHTQHTFTPLFHHLNTIHTEW